MPAIYIEHQGDPNGTHMMTENTKEIAQGVCSFLGVTYRGERTGPYDSNPEYHRVLKVNFTRQRGEDVKRVQQRLQRYVDGMMGEETWYALFPTTKRPSNVTATNSQGKPAIRRVKIRD